MSDTEQIVEPIRAAQESFKAICDAAYGLRPDPGERAVVVDGSMYSPSTRACPYAEFVFTKGSADDWEAFEWELGDCIDSYAHGGYSLGWEDGMLFIYSASYQPED